MNGRVRWISVAEIAAFYVLAMATIWCGDKLRPGILFVALLLVGICVASNFFHGDTRHRVGFSPAEFWPCLRAVLVVCVPLLIPLSFFAWKNRFFAPWNALFEVAGYPLWSFAQEYAMLGFVTNRLEDALDEKTNLIPWINALLFAMAHLPNPVLMTVTFVSAVVFTKIFRAHRHLIPISLAHAVFGTAIGLALSQINGVMSVGPGYYLRIGTPLSW